MADTQTQHMISTDDNPYNPFEKFDQWYAYDQAHGHRSLELLARLARPTDAMSDQEQSQEIEHTIDEISNKLYSTDGEKLVHYIKVTKQSSF